MKQTNEQLAEFIAKARAAGKTDADIQTMLVNSGWDQGVAAQALVPTGDLVPPPPPAPKSSGREIFFYLLQFITLAITATSFGSVIFAAINRYFPDVVGAPYYDTGAIPWPLAALIVAGPIFFLITLALVRDVGAGRTSAMSKVRRVLIYLALFLAAATVIGDLIALVYRFLAGEVNARFLLKVFTILLIGGWVIVYYYITVKRDERKTAYPKSWHKAHAISFVVVALGAIALGFYLNGTPQSNQQLVRDEQRIGALQGISSSVQGYYQTKNQLPAALADLYTGYQPVIPADILTGLPYEYVRGQGTSYQLCATFESSSPDYRSGITRPMYDSYGTNWTHPAGRYCFSLEVVKQPK